MRNKWYVLAVMIPVAGLIVEAIYLLCRGGRLSAVFPAAVATALIVLAVRVGKAESFAPAPPRAPLDAGSSPALERWKAEHAQPR